MSGICGVVRYDGAPVDPACLKAIAEKTPYRMDGGVEYWIHGSIGLAYLASPLSATSSSGLCLGDRLAVAADARLDNRTDRGLAQPFRPRSVGPGRPAFAFGCLSTGSSIRQDNPWNLGGNYTGNLAMNPL